MELQPDVVPEGIPQAEFVAEAPAAVEEPLEIVVEESTANVSTSGEETETAPAVLEAPIEEGIPQAEVAEESEISLSGPVEETVPPSSPASAEEGIPQVEIVQESVTPLPAPSEEVVPPPIESDHAVSTLPAVVPEAYSEAGTPPPIEDATGVIVEGSDRLVGDPSAPVEIMGAEADPPALVEPITNEEAATAVSVPTVEPTLIIPEPSKEAPAPAATIEDLPQADAPLVRAAVNSEAEIIGSLVEPAVVIAPETPQAVGEPAVTEGQHAHDEDSPSPAPEGRTLQRSLLSSLKLTPTLI